MFGLLEERLFDPMKKCKKRCKRWLLMQPKDFFDKESGH
jgi:hypothetical protein